MTAAATFSLSASCARRFDTLLTSCTTISTPLHVAVVTTVLHDRWCCSRRSRRQLMRLHMFSEESVTDVCLCIPAASALIESRFLPPEMALLLKPGFDTAVQTCIRVSEANAAASTRSWSYSLFMLERQVFGFHICPVCTRSTNICHCSWR